MNKKIICALVLALCLSMLTGCCFHKEWYAATCETPKTCVECGETEGEALGHIWVEATCTTPKTCTTCRVTEGEALGHIWVEATTEAPKTCTTCAATEGERIITDPRFTTAATKDLYGKWVSDLTLPSDMLGIEGFEGSLNLQIYIDLDNKGTMGLGYTVTNIDEFNASLTEYLESLMYAEFAAADIGQEDADAAMVAEYGMTVPEYVDSIVKELNFAAIFDALDINGVYYVEGDQLYSGISWDSTLEPSQFTLDGDTLILAEEISGLTEESITFTRSAE